MLNFNGQLFPDTTPLLPADNRAFNYGDGLFETIRVHRQKILFADRHWQRLQQSMESLQMHWPGSFEQEDFVRECLRICPDRGDYRIRATIWRAGKGFYTPESNQVHFLITCNPLKTAPYPFPERGLTIGIFSKIPVSTHALSWIKSTNCLPYIQAALFRQQHKLDDCLLINPSGRIAEAGSSNIFVIQGKKLYTPLLSEGGIRGIIRAVLIDFVGETGLELIEEEMSEERIINAEEVFLTNSIQGIKWVKKYKSSTFAHRKSKLISDLLIQHAL